MQNKNSQIIAIKQASAFSFDLLIISLPLVIAPSLEILPLFTFFWFVYIPLSEFYFSQTLGMKILGTRILNAKNTQEKIELGTVIRRQIARISIFWGLIGWVFLFLGKQYITDYVIVDKHYQSIEIDEDGWIKTHKNNQYKVIFFVLLFAFFVSQIQRLW